MLSDTAHERPLVESLDQFKWQYDLKLDWRDASQYPDPQKTSDLQWYWEFLRRNSSYRIYFYRLPGEPDDTDPDPNLPYTPEIGERIKQLNPYNPRIYFGGQDLDSITIDLSITSAVVHFNLDGDLNKQLRLVKKKLARQRELLLAVDAKHGLQKKGTPAHGKIGTHKKYFRLYLRVFDAFEANVSQTDIVQVLFSDTDPDGKYASRRRQYDLNNSCERSEAISHLNKIRKSAGKFVVHVNWAFLCV